MTCLHIDQGIQYMRIILNNWDENIETEKDEISVSDLLKIRNFSYKMIVVRVNNVLIKKDDYLTKTIKDGDNVQVIHLMTGG